MKTLALVFVERNVVVFGCRLRIADSRGNGTVLVPGTTTTTSPLGGIVCTAGPADVRVNGVRHPADDGQGPAAVPGRPAPIEGDFVVPVQYPSDRHREGGRHRVPLAVAPDGGDADGLEQFPTIRVHEERVVRDRLDVRDPHLDDPVVRRPGLPDAEAWMAGDLLPVGAAAAGSNDGRATEILIRPLYQGQLHGDEYTTVVDFVGRGRGGECNDIQKPRLDLEFEVGVVVIV